MKTPEKLIPKATLLRALHEIMDAARDPGGLALRNVGATDPQDARAFALGWIEGIARGALGVDATTTGWLAATPEERRS